MRWGTINPSSSGVADVPVAAVAAVVLAGELERDLIERARQLQIRIIALRALAQ